MNLRKTISNLSIAAATALAVQAHPGHEPFSEGTKHFISNPNHFIPPLLAGIALIAVAQFLKQRAARNTLRVIAGAIIVVGAIFS